MKINKTGKKDIKGSRIILANENTKLDAFITDPAELVYISERLAGEKNVKKY